MAGRGHAKISKAAATQRMMVLRRPKPVKPRPPSRWHIKLTVFLKAIKNSLGNISEIARRLGVSSSTVKRGLKRWDVAREAFEDEDQKLIGMARDALEDNIVQPLDFGVKQRALEFVLKRRDPAFKDVSTVKIEGGDKPIQIQQLKLIRVIDDMDLSLEVRKAMLDKVRGGLESDEEVKEVPEDKELAG